MSGKDEVTVVPQCPKCNRATVLYDIQTRRRRNRGFYGYAYGVIGYRVVDGDKNVLFVIYRGSIYDTGPEEYIQKEYIQNLRKQEFLSFYGFRCRGCHYLFTKRRMKEHYSNLLNSVQNCLRRGQVSIELAF